MTKHKQPSILLHNPQNKQQTETGIEWRTFYTCIWSWGLSLFSTTVGHLQLLAPLLLGILVPHGSLSWWFLVWGDELHLGNPFVASRVLLLPAASPYCAPSLPTDGSGLAPPISTQSPEVRSQSWVRGSLRRASQINKGASVGDKDAGSCWSGLSASSKFIAFVPVINRQAALAAQPFVLGVGESWGMNLLKELEMLFLPV